MIIKVCIICGKSFEARSRSYCTCSAECKKKRKNAVKNAWRKKRLAEDAEYRERQRELHCESQRRRYRRQREEILQKNQKYYQAHKEELHRKYAEYYRHNQGKILEAHRQWRLLRRDPVLFAKYKRSVRAREYYRRNREKILAQQQTYYRNNKDKNARRSARYYQRNKEKIIARRLIRRKLDRIDEGKKVKPFCHTCGKNFTPRYPGEKFCSDKCRLRSPLWRLFLKSLQDAGF